MKFVCDSCNTKYSIADERVHGRVLKIRCKTCDHVITVREEHKPAPGNIAEAVGRMGQNAGGDGEDHTVVSSMAPPPPPEQVPDEWYVSFDGDQEGPMPLQRALDRVRAERPKGREAHAWRPGFFVWLAIEDVPEFAPALQKPRPPVRPAVKPVPSMKPAVKSPSGSQPVLKAKESEVAKPKTPTPEPPVKAPEIPKLESPAKVEPLPPIDSKPMALPPPPAPLSNDTPLNLPLPLIPAPMPPSDSIPSGPMAVQVTRPEPRLTRKQLEDSIKKPDEKKPVEDKKPEQKKPDERKPEPLLPPMPMAAREPSAPEVSPFGAALAAARGEEPKPFDTGPVPLPPPPGGDNDLAISEPSGLLSISHLAQPSLARSSEKPVIDTFGGVAVTPPGSNGTASAAPVVVVAGPVQSTAPWVKYTIGVLLLLVVSLGAMLIYKSRGPAVEKQPVVADPSTGKRVEDKPIQVADPAPPTSIGLPSDVKKPAPPSAVKHSVPAAKAQPKLSDNQKNLAALYGDSSSEKGTPKNTSIEDHSYKAQAQVSEASILAVVTQNRRALNLCYDRVLKHDSSLKRARLVTHVKVGMSGAVVSVTVPDPEYANSEIGQCLTQTIKHWRFPPADAEYETQFPIILQAE